MNDVMKVIDFTFALNRGPIYLVILMFIFMNMIFQDRHLSINVLKSLIFPTFCIEQLSILSLEKLSGKLFLSLP